MICKSCHAILSFHECMRLHPIRGRQHRRLLRPGHYGPSSRLAWGMYRQADLAGREH
jgi:hypothetical protein